MSDTAQTEPEGPFAVTPRKELERQVMDPNVPKMEREWWAADEITRLRAEVEKLKAARDLVLEEAARCAEDYEGKGMEIDYIRQSGDASRTRSDIAKAIRALKEKQ